MQFIRIRFIKPRYILRPLQPGESVTLSAVTLVTPPHTDQCDYCMCIRLVNKHNESKPFQCIYTFKLHKQQRQIKCKQIQTRVVREVL